MRADTDVELGSERCGIGPLAQGHPSRPPSPVTVLDGPGPWLSPTFLSLSPSPPVPSPWHGIELPSVLPRPGFSLSVHTFARAVPLEKEQEPLGKSVLVSTKTVPGPRAAVRASAHLPPALSLRTPFQGVSLGFL